MADEFATRQLHNGDRVPRRPLIGYRWLVSSLPTGRLAMFCAKALARIAGSSPILNRLEPLARG